MYDLSPMLTSLTTTLLILVAICENGLSCHNIGDSIPEARQLNDSVDGLDNIQLEKQNYICPNTVMMNTFCNKCVHSLNYYLSDKIDETYFDMAEKHLTISINRLDDVSEADLDRVGKKRNIRHDNDNNYLLYSIACDPALWDEFWTDIDRTEWSDNWCIIFSLNVSINDVTISECFNDLRYYRLEQEEDSIECNNDNVTDIKEYYLSQISKHGKNGKHLKLTIIVDTYFTGHSNRIQLIMVMIQMKVNEKMSVLNVLCFVFFVFLFLNCK